MFNPITGAALDLGVANLGYRIKQTLLLNQVNTEFLKGLVIMDENEGVHVYPPACSANIGNTYMFVADPNTAVVQGYVLRNNDMVCNKLNNFSKCIYIVTKCGLSIHNAHQPNLV